MRHGNLATSPLATASVCFFKGFLQTFTISSTVVFTSSLRLFGSGLLPSARIFCNLADNDPRGNSNVSAQFKSCEREACGVVAVASVPRRLAGVIEEVEAFFPK